MILIPVGQQIRTHVQRVRPPFRSSSGRLEGNFFSAKAIVDLLVSLRRIQPCYMSLRDLEYVVAIRMCTNSGL